MATNINYTIPVDLTGWDVPNEFDTHFTWDYDDGRDSLLNLYAKGKEQQWDAQGRIDWSQDLDPENPMLLPDESNQIADTDVWRKLSAAISRRGRLPSSCTANRARWSAQRRSSSRCPISIRNSMPPPR